jgi:ankyrin repeat protein
LKSSLRSAKSVVGEPILRIEQYENEVYKLVCLVQNECMNTSLADAIAKIKQSVLEPHISNEDRRKRLSAWINAVDTKKTYETALQYHHDGTCEWALRLEELQTWASPQPAQGKLLWIHGPPGFGKTFMSAWIIQHLIKESRGPVSYFFCVAADQLTRDPYSILRSWLSQLLDQDKAILPLMDALFATRTSKDQSLTHLELWQLFIAVGESITECTFVMDGFDECTHVNSGAQYHTEDPRSYFLRDLVLHLSKTTSRILVVSRDAPDIRVYLHKGSVYSPGIEMYEYKIEAKDTAVDVKAFSESMVNQRLPKKNPILRGQIAEQAAERSEGMFLWIKLLEKEISPGQNAKELSKMVLEMPSGISEAYTREVEKITILPPRHKDKALTILRWVLFAVRPLQVKELAEALIVSDEDELEGYPQDDLPDTWAESFVDEDYVNEMILGRCGSLLQLRSPTREPLANHTVHFVHFSVQEYLSRLPLTNPLAEGLGLADSGAEEIRLSKICLRYLALDVFEEIPPSTDVYPFLSYAAWAWYFHAFHDKPTPSQDIMHRTQKVFDPSNSSWRVWSPVLEAELHDSEDEGWDDFETASDSSSNSGIEGSDDEQLAESLVPGLELSRPQETVLLPSSVPNPMYYASLLGLKDVISWLEEQGLDCNCVGGRFGFPLQAAVARSHEEVVTHLLNRHVNISQNGGQYNAAIIAAAALSTPEILQILMNAGADLTAMDERRWTALHHASKRGAAKIVEQLIDGGANINAVTDSGSTATSLACENGSKDVLSLLIAKDARLDLENKAGDTPLHVAIKTGHEDMACKLLDAGASVDVQQLKGIAPLLLAVANDCLAVVKKLLDKNTKVESSEGRTLLHQAAASAGPKIVEELLRAGADVAWSDNHGATPLHVASVMNRPEIIKLLLDHGANLDQASEGNLKPLFAAVENGSLAAFKVLLERGASLQCIYEHSQSTLFDVARRSSETAEVLVRHGCFRVRSQMNTIPQQRTAVAEEPEHNLAMIVLSGDTEQAKNFIKARASNIGQDVLDEALHIAANRGFANIVTHLLENGAKVDRKDLNGRTALHHAAFHNHKDVANTLVDNGASLSVEDDIGSTPMDLSVKRGLKALGFIQRHMGDFSNSIRRRPSLLDNTRGEVNTTTAAGVREAISGSWKGYYQHLSWEEGRQDAFSIAIPDTMPGESSGCTFSNEDSVDTVGRFQFHGFVDEKGIVWFAKLYARIGWLYRGQLDPDQQTLRGTWGGNRKLWFGTFKLSRSS